RRGHSGPQRSEPMKRYLSVAATVFTSLAVAQRASADPLPTWYNKYLVLGQPAAWYRNYLHDAQISYNQMLSQRDLARTQRDNAIAAKNTAIAERNNAIAQR